MQVYELSDLEFQSAAMQTTVATESTAEGAVILHGIHPQRGEIVLMRIGAAHFLISGDNTGSPLGQLLTELERL